MNRVLAVKLETPTGIEGLPSLSAWEKAPPVFFCSDWRGEHADPLRETQAQLLWSKERLFVRFLCRYREIYVYEGNQGRRDKLWLRDVAEVFIRPSAEELTHYREFEISPNGDWLDLNIAPGTRSFLFCDLKSRVAVTPDARIWTAELALPINGLTAAFNPGDVWRLNLFRVEGREPNRFYSAWQPTFTLHPNFHVPESFGELHFA
jgi:alpha-galactosidase